MLFHQEKLEIHSSNSLFNLKTLYKITIIIVQIDKIVSLNKVSLYNRFLLSMFPSKMRKFKFHAQNVTRILLNIIRSNQDRIARSSARMESRKITVKSGVFAVKSFAV